MSKRDAGDYRRYVAFVRDSWGFAKRVGEPREMTPKEAAGEADARRQTQMGWLVPEPEAENVR